MFVWYQPELRTHFSSLSLVGISIKPHLLRLLNCFESIARWGFIYSQILFQPLFSFVSHYIGFCSVSHWRCTSIDFWVFIFFRILYQCQESMSNVFSSFIFVLDVMYMFLWTVYFNSLIQLWIECINHAQQPINLSYIALRFQGSK